MQPIPKDELERLCVEALNRTLRTRAVHAVKLGRPAIGTANWTLHEVEPRFDLNDVHQSHAAIRDLQRQYRMVT